MSVIDEQLIALVNGAKDKDSRAIEFLYNEFYSDVYYICYKILGNQEDAMDIAQETFLEAFIGIDNLNNPLSFKFWICRIATNKSFNFLKRSNRISLQTPETIEQFLDVEDVQANPEDVVIDSDVKYTLESIMSRLPDEQRRTLFLFYYEEMSVKEIAQLYQCPESTIKSRLSYARKFMRKEVERLENEGYKLRCLTALPFLFALFNAEKSSTMIVGQGDIIGALNAYISSVPTVNANNNGYPNYDIPNNIAQPNPVSKLYTISKISKSAKIAAAVVGSVVVISGAVLAGTLIHNHNKNEIPTDNDIVSQITDENSKPSNNSSELDDITSNDDDETISNPDEDNSYIKWQFREVDVPKFENSTYVEVMPYKDAESLDDEKRQKKEKISTPSFYVDVESAKNKLKNNNLMKSEFEFSDIGIESQDVCIFDGMGVQVKYTVDDGIYGYKLGTVEDKSTLNFYDYDFIFESQQVYSQYNTPNHYEISIESDKMSQDDIYNIVKDVFGEELAQWSVYGKTDKEVKKDENSYYVEVETPDGKCKYFLSRLISRDDDNAPYKFSLNIRIKDSGITLNSSSIGAYQHYANGYTPFEMDISLADLFQSDVGSTDLNKPMEFFNKALDSTGEKTFAYTVLTTVVKKYIKYSDGSVYNYYEIEGGQGLQENMGVIYYSGSFGLTLDAFKNADGDINVNEFELDVPTGFAEESSELQKLAIKKASEILGLPESELYENIEEDTHRTVTYEVVKEIKLFNQTLPEADIGFTIYKDDSSSSFFVRYEYD